MNEAQQDSAADIAEADAQETAGIVSARTPSTEESAAEGVEGADASQETGDSEGGDEAEGEQGGEAQDNVIADGTIYDDGLGQQDEYLDGTGEGE